MPEIGEWVLGEACRQMHDWQTLVWRPFRLAVNVSASQVGPDFLRCLGVRFAADDFGTGYSCLRHLKCCPITTLKIDQSFVAGLANDARDQIIVRTVIQLAHGLGMDVVAEGVETPAGLAQLRQADCDAAQGFLFAKPMPAEAFAGFVKGGVPEPQAPG